MKRFTSAIILATLLITGSASVASAAPAKSGQTITVSSTDRISGWPY